MSTILKALQRLEDEKSASVERSLGEQVVARRPPPDPERRGMKIGVIAIGGFAVAAAALLFWYTREEPNAEVALESPPPATAPAPATEVVAEKLRRKPSVRPAPEQRAPKDSPEIEISSVVEVVQLLDAPPADSDAPEALQKSVAPIANAGAERPTRRSRASKSDPQVARGAEQPRAAPKRVADAKPPATPISGNSEPATSAPALPAPVEIAAIAPKLAPAAAPAPIPAAVRDLEQTVIQRAKLPTLSVEKTIWHPDADRRVAVVKLVDADEVLRLKEGDAVGPLVVIAINPESVVFNHDGIEIRYNVGG